MITTINEFKKFNWQKPDPVPNSNGYQYLGGSSKYLIVKIHDQYRIENYNGIYQTEVPYVDVPKEFAENWLDMLSYYKDEEPKYRKEAKTAGLTEFNNEMDNMFDDEHTELYPKSVSENFSQKEYLKWKRANVSYRGMKSIGEPNGVHGRFGDGLYTAALSNKSYAKGYGELRFVVNGRPKNPKKVQSYNYAEIFIQNLIDNYNKAHNIERHSEFYNHTTIAKEMLNLGYDGLEISGAEYVNYTPDMDKVKYYKTEEELKWHFENYVQEDINENFFSNLLNKLRKPKEKKYTPDPIDPKTMGPNDIFVFGSNTEGAHGGGAAKAAVNYYGAIWGQARGLQGNSYGIVTLDYTGKEPVTLSTIGQELDTLIAFAKQHKQLTFWMTKIGTGISKIPFNDIVNLFEERSKYWPKNIILPKEFTIEI